MTSLIRLSTIPTMRSLALLSRASYPVLSRRMISMASHDPHFFNPDLPLPRSASSSKSNFSSSETKPRSDWLTELALITGIVVPCIAAGGYLQESEQFHEIPEDVLEFLLCP
ncbi:hypothetical protein VKT23_012023 [Stygiomarasmius scandens]|uniref:Uncharacterized protein n=1 Tax=Marasmiellus scandens TaxID=2682957 RepID=A0ABR1J7L5_9AGAR